MDKNKGLAKRVVKEKERTPNIEKFSMASASQRGITTVIWLDEMIREVGGRGIKWEEMRKQELQHAKAIKNSKLKKNKLRR